MKPYIPSKRNQALTLFEVMVIIAALMILAVMILPIITAQKIRAPRINCVSNLKQVALAARIWEGDHDGKYPMSVSVTNGGAMELIATGNVAACFQIMSNELSTTKILVCPADMDHLYASNFLTINSSNISYFINSDASETYPQMLFLGDDNLATNGVPLKSGLASISSNTRISWTSARHKNCGNIAFADGSVAEESANGFMNALQYGSNGTPVTTNRWAIP